MLEFREYSGYPKLSRPFPAQAEPLLIPQHILDGLIMACVYLLHYKGAEVVRGEFLLTMFMQFDLVVHLILCFDVLDLAGEMFFFDPLGLFAPIY